ncbi:Hint domain-containing protein [Reyranella sp.]|uniref:Hint domain-containing protein n=1 Tax=Reyranella sp. TaxID=1929291 RepID=UPI003D132B5F
MNRTPQVDRVRRNALKATGLILGAIVANGVPFKGASAQSPLGPNLPGPPVMAPPPPKPNNWVNCFARGTQIRTRAGYRPIETMAAGDEVAVRFGGFAPIKAMTNHTLNGVAGKWEGTPDNLPVVIQRGALGENLPSADLCLTALHAVYVDGFLMKAGDLINGTSILLKAPDGQDNLDFFNIELERHDILDVQGASVESFYRAGTERCAPLLGFDGNRSRLRSHMRSIASVVIDRRQPIDIIRDKIEERGLGFARAA